MAQYSWALGSLFVTSYDLQGYSRGILTCHQVQVQVILLPTVSHPVCLSVGPSSGGHDQIFITVRHLWSVCCGAPSLLRGRICNLLIQFAVILRPKAHRTHDHILLSHLRQLGSFFVTSYDSQGYSGGILTCLQSRVMLWLMVSQSICLGAEPTLDFLSVLSEGFCWKVAFLSLWGALSDERSGLSCVSLQPVVICLYEHLVCTFICV
jgi:hypothetical protein